MKRFSPAKASQVQARAERRSQATLRRQEAKAETDRREKEARAKARQEEKERKLQDKRGGQPDYMIVINAVLSDDGYVLMGGAPSEHAICTSSLRLILNRRRRILKEDGSRKVDVVRIQHGVLATACFHGDKFAGWLYSDGSRRAS